MKKRPGWPPAKIRTPQEVLRLVRSAHPLIKRKIRAALIQIQEEPEAGKALRDERLGLRSYRVGRLRIIYRVARIGVIDIVAIGPRRTIYEETFRLIQSREATGSTRKREE